MRTRVVNIHKIKHYDVYIGRGQGSKWGNPYVVGVDGTREEVIEKYRQHLRSRPDLVNSLSELQGKVLGCFCDPLPCHGHILADLADGLDEL